MKKTTIILESLDEESQLDFEDQNIFRILVLCANDETINNKKTLSIIKHFLKKIRNEDTNEKLFDKETINNSIYECYYVNAIDTEIAENLEQKNKFVYLANISELNEDLFDDNFFDIIFDEYCPINVGWVLTQNTFRWFHRILRQGDLGYIIINDFLDNLKENREVFYEMLQDAFKIDNVKDLLEHIKIYYDEPTEEDLSVELSTYDDLETILHKYCDEQIKMYYEDILTEEPRLFMIEDIKIKSIDELNSIMMEYFACISISIFDNKYVLMKKF